MLVLHSTPQTYSSVHSPIVNAARRVSAATSSTNAAKYSAPT